MKRVDVTRLRELTVEAIRRGEEERERVEKAKLDAAEREKRLDEKKAMAVIEQIPERAEKEARQGRNHAIVYSLKERDDIDSDHACRDKHMYQRLKRVGKIVWDYCVEAKLCPTIEDWHDGGGMYGGYNIVIHWPKT